ncbi:MAG: ABC-2 family transporter protein [Oscillospiraceae bacterium]|nr:ABC-2 family transporter protein [Oscillospiraceae bacterium]
MKRIIGRVGYYIKLLFAFMRISLLSQLEYRLNFISGIAVESAYMCIKLTYLVVVMRSGVNIGALTPDMVMVFIGTYCFMTGMLCFFWSIAGIPHKVLAGNLDMMIVKPGSLMFMLTFGGFDFAMTVPNCTVGITLICVGWSRANIPVTAESAGGFLFFILMGIVLTYAFMVIQALLVFWVTAINGTYAVAFALWDFNNMPMALYGKAVQRIGTFVIPIFMITNWAGLFVLKQLTALEILWGIAAPIAVILLTRLMWKRGMKRYISANG